MARWQLTEPHYLRSPNTRWEQTVTDRNTGKPMRKVFEVPLHLDPRVESDWNRKDGFMDGTITVCHAGKGLPDGRDIEFLGDPTPGMLPLDDEAREISGRFTWTPTQGLDEVSQANSNQQRLLNGLFDTMEQLKNNASAAPQGEGFSEVIKTMQAMMQQQMQMFQMLMEKQHGISPAVDDAPPLDEPEAPTEEELAESAGQASIAETASAGRATAHAEAATRRGR